jgi:biopolymer transport protein TolR
MAFGGGEGGGPPRAMSEINVTPLVDVMLVLLIVFMVTTPIIVESDCERKLEVDLPRTNAEPVAMSDLQTIVELTLDKRVLLDRGLEGPDGGKSPLLEACAEYPACLEGFEEKLKVIPTLAEYREGNRLFLLADRGLPYGFVIDVMARMKAAGITNIGMVTNPPAKPGEAP